MEEKPRVQTKLPSVIHLTSVHQPYDVQVFEKQARSYAAEGAEVWYVVPHDRDEVLNGIRIVAVPRVRSRPLRMTLTVARVAWHALRTRAGIYHLHDPELLPLGLLLKLLGRRVIFNSREDMPRCLLSKPYLAKPFRRPVSRAYELFENWCVRRFDAVIGATDHITARFAGLGVRRVVSVSNHPELTDFPPPPDWTRKEDAVCFVGGITHIRGILEMIDAVELAGVRLILAGEFYSDALHAEAMARPGWRLVEELGVVSRAETVKVMHRSFAGLVLYHPEPNHTEAEPNKLFEYMAAGLPVIASDFPLWRRLVADAERGVVTDPRDPARIAAAITTVRNDLARAREMGERGRRAAMETYNWTPQYEKMKALYLDICRPV